MHVVMMIQTLRKQDRNTCFFSTKNEHIYVCALPTALPRQLSWLSSNLPYKLRHSKAKQEPSSGNTVRLTDEVRLEEMGGDRGDKMAATG